MHGRVKVRSSEEERARKDKERQEKLIVFKNAMQKIQLKRKQNELDKELLEMTGKVLSSNPDVYTLWNVRREVINEIRKSSENEEELSQLHDSELQLTEHCLKTNPKSYCAWHQREWVLLSRPDPDWPKELALCNTYLELDERNFHTWDYRRFVIDQCQPPLEEEFDYTTGKLYANFSNYSAWHYRSKMLVKLYPDLAGGRPIEDCHHKHELKMVQNAAFTDPDDTSAWFYQNWLLGAVKTNIQPVVCSTTPAKTTVAFNNSVSKDFVEKTTKITINDIPLTGQFVSCLEKPYDDLWIFEHTTDIINGLDVKLHFESEEGDIEVTQCVELEPSVYVGKYKIDFQHQYSDPVIEELNNQLNSCRQLLALEPENKWTLLTTTVFLHCSNAKLHHTEVVDNLRRLKIIDKPRAGYYNDLITKWCMEQQIMVDYTKNSLDVEISFPEKITSLPHLHYYSFCVNVDLSNQNLSSNVLPSLIVLQGCKKLSLKNNKLTTLKNFPDLNLYELNLEGNVGLDETELVEFEWKRNFSVISSNNQD